MGRNLRVLLAMVLFFVYIYIASTGGTIAGYDSDMIKECVSQELEFDTDFLKK